MEVILLEKIGQLGDLGAVVNVRPGYGRNYLIPKGKALPATKANMARFEAEREAFEARQQDVMAAAEALAEKLADVQVVIDRPAGSSGKLFGSVTNSDISAYFGGVDLDVPRRVIDVPQPIRTLGEHTVFLRLHPDLIPEITVLVERSIR